MSTLSYASKTDLENLLLVNIDATFNTQIDTWISVAETMVNNYLGFTTASGIWNESVVNELNDTHVDGDLNLVIYPRKRPVNSVSNITIVKGPVNVSLSLTDTDGNTRYQIPVQQNVIVYPNYQLSLTASTILHHFGIIKYSRFYTKVSYIGGYTTIPGPINLATTYYVADIFMRQANKEGLSSITQGRITKRWAEERDGRSNWMRRAEEMLNYYRIASGWL
jgi:hypothetical protein